MRTCRCLADRGPLGTGGFATANPYRQVSGLWSLVFRLPQPATRNPQPATGDPQPSTFSSQPSTRTACYLFGSIGLGWVYEPGPLYLVVIGGVLVPIPSDVFEGGKTYAEYRQQILDAGGPSRDKLELSESTLAQTKIDVEPFSRLPKPLKVLVLSEAWCSDCSDNVPILNRIAEETGKLNVRIISRDEHLEIADQYLKDGEFRAIPTMIFMDDQMNEIGTFMERPQSVTDLRAQKRAELFAQHPEFGSQDTPASELPDDIRAALSASLAESRASTRPFAIQEVVRELSAVAADAAGA
jgi:hypothetical protein